MLGYPIPGESEQSAEIRVRQVMTEIRRKLHLHDVETVLISWREIIMNSRFRLEYKGYKQQRVAQYEHTAQLDHELGTLRWWNHKNGIFVAHNH